MFINDYQKHDYQLRHYRKVLKSDAAEENDITSIYDDMAQVLDQLGIPQKYSEQLAEVVVELVGNVYEHNKSTGILDVDISDIYGKKTINDNGEYRGVNVSLVSFSDCIFGSSIVSKIKEHKMPMGRYAKLKETYYFHSGFFDETYTEQDFGFICSFQDRVTGRDNEYKSGGTGLTCLLESLEEMADATNCYLLTQNRKMRFFKELLKRDDDNWVGFNREHNFFTTPPDKGFIVENDFNLPGIAYNLNFVINCKEDNV